MLNKSLIFLILLSLLNCSTNNFNVQNEKAKINTFLNEWHHAATIADEDTFFDSFTEDGIYIGTDPKELWTAKELKEWSKEFFDKDSAWDFKPIDRNIYFDASKNVAWFNETLDTWMGTCRSSGVLIKIRNKWKISHYHLSVAVDNDDMDKYLEIIHK